MSKEASGPGPRTEPASDDDASSGHQVEPQEQAPARRPVRSGFRAVREVAIVVATALVLSLIVKTFLLQAFWIPSGSMENTLVYGDRVIVTKFVPGPIALKRGDVVVFEDPDHWLETPPTADRGTVRNVVHDALEFVGIVPTGEGNHLIKRVIGLPGDHVTCSGPDGKLTVNGTEIIEPYLHPGDPPSMQQFDITVPPGKVWVMGDHRSDSGDSRFHDNGTGGRDGSVPEDRIVGRAVALVWPLDRVDWLGNYSSTFASVPAPKP